MTDTPRPDLPDDPSANPLFGRDELPRFDRIEPKHVVPAIRALVPKLLADLEEMEKNLEPTWEGVVARLTAIGEPLAWAWGVTSHLMGVKNSPELREAYEAVQGEVVTAWMRVGQSRPIYDALLSLRDSPEWTKLEEAQRRVVEASIRGAKLSGVGLEGAARERFQAIAMELSELSTTFSNHVLDATKAFALTLRDPLEVEGLPPTVLATAAQAARAAGEEGATPERGPWRITLDAPVFVPFMEHGRRRELREKLYRAYVTRASSGDLDNQPLIDRILALRAEEAGLLGYPTYARMSLASKMAPDVAAIDKLLGELRTAAFSRAKQELAELTGFARERSGDPRLELALWDVAFWAERLREERYAYTEEELRPYFPLPRVLEGLFAVAERLFGVSIRPADGEAAVWNPDVRFFEVYAADPATDRSGPEPGAHLASFYLDPYSRPENKRGGAWMDNALDRKRLAAGLRRPVAYLVCNQTPPVGDEPPLMTFQEVETLFHEFGHGLQHMLTRVDYVEAAGINNVEWDAVELPSQFMENWCFDRATMLGVEGRQGLARHYKTGEPLPEALFEKIRAARTYRAGSTTLRQVYFASLDLELHHRYRPGAGESVLDVQRRIAAENTVMPPLAEDRFLCGFGHIFAGGYAAGYYSYKWAEVLSADAFGAFEEAGLDRPEEVRRTGRRFRDTVLALGGGRHPMQVFEAFRGRPPSTEALLRQSGLR